MVLPQDPGTDTVPTSGKGPDRFDAYPEALVRGGWYIMVYYCCAASMVIGCKTDVHAKVLGQSTII